MSKTLILPDVHTRYELAETIIDKVKPDLTIFLGDFFDDFNDSPMVAENVALWFVKSINKTDRIHLCGNHDVMYWFKDNMNTRCSGYHHSKSFVINNIVKRTDWEKLKFFHVLDNKWLLSHAGVHPVWINSDEFKSSTISEAKLSDIVEKLEYDSTQAIKNLQSNNDHWFTYAGFSRSMRSRSYGGLLWCDWNQEFIPMRGIHQIVGHTPQRSLQKVVVHEDSDKYVVLPVEDSTSTDSSVMTDKNSYNICLDSHPGSQYYAIYENNALTVHKVSDLK